MLGPRLTSRLRRLGQGLVLLAASTLVALVLGEAAARSVLDVRPFRYVADADSPRHWNLDHPTRGYALTPGWHGRLEATEYAVRVEIDPQGLRSTPDAPVDGLQPGASTVRILAAGDSFVFGVGLEPDETLPARLAHHLAAAGVDAEVSNLGVPGYALQPTILHLEEWLDEATDAIVLFLYVGSRASGANDVTGAVEFARAMEDPNPDAGAVDDAPTANDSAPTATRRLSARPAAKATKTWLARRSALYNAVLVAIGPRLRAWRHGATAGQTGEAAVFEQGWTLTDLWLERLARTAKDVPIVLVLVPELPDLLRDVDQPARRLEALAARHAAAYVDGAAVLDGPGVSALYYPLDGHLRPAGAERLAAAVAPVLTHALDARASRSDTASSETTSSETTRTTS
ncbi:MAG: hypothetical protein AAGC60_11140 [Acidobacteriota bacterium]